SSTGTALLPDLDLERLEPEVLPGRAHVRAIADLSQPAEGLDLCAVADVGPRGRARQPDAHGFDTEVLSGGSGDGTVTDRGLPADVLHVSLVRDAEAEGHLRAVAGPAPVRARVGVRLGREVHVSLHAVA